MRAGLTDDRAKASSGPKIGLSLMPSDDWWVANEPLFLQNVVDAVEWSVDFGFGPGGEPPWLTPLLERFEQRGSLYAHGVELSPMSARWTWQQDEWLDALAAACERRRFAHLTEHYGFITASDFVRGTPLPLPPSTAALDLASRGVEAMRERSGLSVGIENLAFALSKRDVEAQATFIGRLLEQTDAFLLFDVHNLWCQAHNFEIDPLALACAYPLDRVREIHVAGGGYSVPASDPQARPFRRDSHDDRAPREVLVLLEALLDRCPNLETIILERSDRSLFGRDEAERHHEEFLRLKTLVKHRRRRTTPLEEREPVARIELARDDEDALDAYQSALLEALDTHETPKLSLDALRGDDRLGAYHDHIGTFEPRAVEVARSLVKQWGVRVEPADSMRAAVLTELRAPLELRYLPRVAPGPGQVALRVAAVGLCGTDAHVVEGRFPVPLPIVLGHETVGVVEALGEGVDTLAVGDRVGVSWIQAGCGECDGCNRGFEMRCTNPRTWIENGGGLSELAIAEASGCTKLPEALSFEEAAPLFCAGHVVMSGYRRAAPQPGERIAVIGLGGLGHLALQVARAHGHEVAAVSTNLSKLEDARAYFAADHVVLAEGDDTGAAIDRIGGADVILATTSSMKQAARAVSGLRLGGRLVVMGLGEGILPIDAAELVQREACVAGSVQGPREDLDDVLDLAARGLVRARVEAFPLMLAQRAMARLLDRRVRYRAVVTM